MTHYLALVHKEADSCYGVSFPDVPGVIAAGDTLDEAVEKAGEALAFAAEDWHQYAGAPFPAPRSFEALRADLEAATIAREAVWVAIPLRSRFQEAA
ncbi:MAG: type II toxin-antitoxin system HicB family antitoxin [Methylobacteriaceae bacterium]|nr:type II toxin-antitoxin system HicB family antitoxin [Methylobacteriaceae bacterium]